MPSPMSALTSAESQSKSGASLVLQHPSGGQVYLVGVAHVSGKAAQEVTEVIQTVSPRIVVLELDQERFEGLQQAAEKGDRYGLQKHLQYGAFQPFVVALSGNALEYMLSLAYVVGGALLGSPAGGEFLSAKDAATQVGAEVVLGDRNQRVTLQRMTALAAKMRRGPSMQPQSSDQQLVPRSPSREAKRRQEQGSAESSTGSLTGDLSQAEMPGSSTREHNGTSNETWGNENAQGSGMLDETETGQVVQQLVKEPGAAMDLNRWGAILQKGGCNNGQAVIDAFKRMLKTGSSKNGSVSTEDLLTVRSCGTKMLEQFRQEALKEGDDGMKQVEDEALMGLKGAAGFDSSREAMHEVLGHERDLILARRLWEAGERAEGQGVVGIVGAAHVKGIANRWAEAGSEKTRQQVQEYCGGGVGGAGAVPVNAGTYINVAAGAGIGYLLWRRPRFAKFTGAVGAIILGPYLVFATPVLRKYQNFAANVVKAAEQVQSAGPTGFRD